ncbi:CaiB/BaiF CoA-transferase family protein [Aquabacter spiritensis]|uniref:Crotonobetainyl-CoA:carnitine CoA-transferase CaiB-like acyl-CoA transferase n=1 Tax=Aquabacter spiritensis TaxID=933073 RepID=A0A4R3LZY9_9HYPH|nr:CoA transferase [Aquabacter spiritensis]TCT04367.1 crotonobetainyl-CoA:carnitine CoA-transferase CaiB-like acyl-CoA transferase [Aquabacter spiritensis]
METGALDGIVVLELGARVAAGACGSLLAQLGATVVLVEGLPVVGPGAKWDARAQIALGKLSLRLDASDPADRARLAALAARADVVLISSDMDGPCAFLPEGWTEGRIVCDFTAFGAATPRGTVPVAEAQIQALTGIIDTTGDPGGAPVPVDLPVVEAMTAAYGAAGVVAALRVARRTGLVQTIDMALYDCAFAAMATFLPRLLAGEDGSPERIGNRHAMISPWNVFRAADGWVLICAGTDQQWQRLCTLMARPDLADDPRTAHIADRVRHAAEVDAQVGAWAATQSVAACIARLSEIAIACGPVAEISGHPVEPNLDARGLVRRVRDAAGGHALFLPGSPLQMDATPGRVPEDLPAPDSGRADIDRLLATAHPAAAAGARPATPPEAPPEAPLAGVRVVEIGHYTTAPLATKHLAALGAEVIKIEPPEGEATRAWPPTQDGQGYFFTYMNSDKKSVTLDLGTPAGAASLRALLATADILVENLKPGALAKRGFSPEAVHALNPRLVYCSVSGFGARGLYPGRPAFDTVIQAMSGLMDVVRADGVPMKTGISTSDLLGAQISLLAMLAALEHRDATGQGQWIDLSMQDITAWLTQWAWNGARFGADWRLEACADGYVMLRAPRADPAPAALAEGRDLPRAQLVAALEAAGIPAAPVLGVAEMFAQPLPAARGLYVRVAAEGRDWPLLKTPIGLAATPPRVRHPMPALGRDTAVYVGGA